MPQCHQYEEPVTPDQVSSALRDKGAIAPRNRKLTGCVQAIDHFGNVITNIPGIQVLGRQWSLLIDDTTLPSKETYSDGQPGGLLALVGSHGWVEIAVNGGSAQAKLKLELGMPVHVVSS
jgi:S-adenosyl-L-methionine hydrolase (adenosine-forming)